MPRIFALLLRLSFFFLICFLSQSCATILNGRYTHIKVKTTEPVKIVANGDTLTSIDNTTQITVPRQKASLKIELISDTLLKAVTIPSKTSPVYYANFAFLYGLGALIEKNQPERYTYPHIIYTDVSNTRDAYATFDSTILGKTYILKFTPIRLVALSNPSIEFSLEKSTGNRFATQLMVSYLIPSIFDKVTYDINTHTHGLRLAIEEKFYLKKSSPKGRYIAFEFNYLNTNYRDYSFFTNGKEITDSLYISYPDNFNVKKQTFSLNLKYGYQMIRGPFTFDAYVGIGARYKSVQHYGKMDPGSELERPRHPNFYYFTNQEGDFWTLSLTANFKLGWIIPQKTKRL